MAAPELVNPMADFTPLVDAARGSATRVHAAIHSNVDSDRISEATTEMMRAAACNYWAQGIDGLYIAHWFSYWPYEAPFYEKLRELPHPDVMAPKDKIYYIPTETGRYPRPVTEPGVTTQLPAKLAPDRPAALDVRVSDDLHRWDDAGRVHEVLLRVRVMNANERNRIRLTLNGKELPQSLLRTINQIYRMTAPRYRTGYGYWYVYRLDRDHWPVQGINKLEVALTEYDDEVAVEPYLRDVELEVALPHGQELPPRQRPRPGSHRIRLRASGVKSPPTLPLREIDVPRTHVLTYPHAQTPSAYLRYASTAPALDDSVGAALVAAHGPVPISSKGLQDLLSRLPETLRAAPNSLDPPHTKWNEMEQNGTLFPGESVEGHPNPRVDLSRFTRR